MEPAPEAQLQLPSFSEAFGPLAHHLFPDGCPEESLESVWPTRNNRATVSHIQARQSFASLKQIAQEIGFSALKMECLTVAACATLPSFIGAASGSPLVDGSSKCLRELLRCMIPGRDHRLSAFVVTNLVTLQCDDLGKAIICRFLTLCLRSGSLAVAARQQLGSFYTLLFSWLPCPDTFRLVHALTRRNNVRPDRAKRLRMWYDSSTRSPELQKGIGPLWLLLQLYARYDPVGCGKYFSPSSSKRNGGALSKHFQIPDEAWEQDFLRSQINNEEPSQSMERPEKRQRLEEASSMHWLEDAFDGVHSFSLGLAVGQQHRRILRASDILMDDTIRSLLVLSKDDGIEVVRLRACLPYMMHEEWWLRRRQRLVKVKEHTGYDDDDNDVDESLRSAGSTNETEEDEATEDDTGSIAETMQSKADFAEFDDPRMRVLRAVVSFASHSSSLLPEIETFLLSEVVPYWDGTDQVGQLLCHGLLPFFAPRLFTDLNNTVLCHLAPLIHYGSPRAQYHIISGALASMLKRWCYCDMSGVIQKKKLSDTSMSVKERTLRDLIQWTESQILKAMLLNDGHELLRESALDLFSAVVEHCPYLVLPGPSLVYRLLLSKTASCIDYLCALLVKYKFVLQRRQQTSEKDDEELQQSIALFNCYVWDICSVLWRKSPLPSTDSSEEDAARSKSILFTDVKPETLGFLQENYDSFSVALSVTHGAAFRCYVRAFWGDKDEGVLEGKAKLKYLDFLQAQGLVGVHGFLTSFVASLASREERRHSRQKTR